MLPASCGGARIAPSMRLKVITGGISPLSKGIRLAAATLFLSFVALVAARTAHGQSRATSRTTLETISPSTFSVALAAENGPLPASQRFSLTLTLAQTSTRAAALDQFLCDLATPASPNYRKWISPAQFAAAYGATPEQIAAATAWLQAQGLSVDAVSPSGLRLSVSGFTAQVETAFAVDLHLYQVNGYSYFANANAPSLPSEAAGFFTSIEGLDDLPADLATWGGGPKTTHLTLLNGSPASLDIASISALVDANAMPIVTIDATFGTNTPSASAIAGYTALFRQAAAQGITTLLTRTAVYEGFPSGLPEVTDIAGQYDAPDTQTPFAVRPAWQVAPGLPADGLRHAPDLTASSVSALASTLSSVASRLAGQRLGNINPELYQLAPTPDLFTQPDSAPAGTWEPATGLGLVNLAELAKAMATGSGTSYTSVASSNYAPTHGQSITLTSNVTSGTGGATPTGTVTFVTSTGITLGSAALNASGTATYTTDQLAGGSNVIQANYSGNSTYAASSSPTTGIFVQPEPSALTVTVSSGNVYGGNSTVTVTDAATSGVGQPGGNITLTIEGPGTVFTQALAPSGVNSAVAIFTLPATTVGTQTVSINCAATPSFSCNNPFTTTVTVAKATPGLALTYSPNPPVSGGSISLTATMTGVPGAAMPTGNVLFYDNATILNGGTLSNGKTTVTGTVPSTATHSISANYNGDANYNTAIAVGITVATTTAMTASSYTVASGQSVTLSASVTPASVVGGVQPTGTVTFTAASQGVIGIATVMAGVATLTTALPAGVYTLTVTYSGDSSYASSYAAAPNAVTVAAAVTLISTATKLTYSPTTPAVGQTVTLTATVTSATSASAAISGSVMFFSGTTQLGQGTIASGVATATFVLTATNGQNVTAVYSGDTNYATSTSTAVTVLAALAPATVTLTASPNTGFTGSPITFTAQVSGTVTPVASPTGTVNFYLSGITPVLFSTATLTSTGANTSAATFTTSSIPAGTQSVYAVYSGDTNFATAVSSTITLGLTDYALAFTPATLTLTSGQSGSTTIQVNTQGSFTGTITLSCMPPPDALVTCSLSQTSLLGNGTSTLTVSTTAGASTQNRGSDLKAIGGVSLAALLCFLLPGRRRLPTLLLVLLALGLFADAGCTSSTTTGSGGTVGTPLGTVNVTVDSVGSNGSTAISHDYAYQVTIQ